jgi:hypothetical protein
VRRTCLIVLFAALCIDVCASTASAQLFPRRRNSGAYDADYYDAAVGAAALSSSNAAARSTAQGFQQWSQLPTQGPGGGMTDRGADRRVERDYSQQQANRDWWFQVQAQQVADRRAAAPSAPPTVQLTPTPIPLSPSRAASITDSSIYAAPASMGFESSSYTPPVTSTVIRWPPVLCYPRLDQERAKVEAPYRRKSDGQGPSNPTAADYKNMIEATARMKTILQGLKDDVSRQDYVDAVAFLDQLADEARARLPK